MKLNFFHIILTATQEKRIPSPGKNAMIYFDGVILSHCNEAEWNKFKSEHTNEAILDRILKDRSALRSRARPGDKDL